MLGLREAMLKHDCDLLAKTTFRLPYSSLIYTPNSFADKKKMELAQASSAFFGVLGYKLCSHLPDSKQRCLLIFALPQT